MFIYKEKNYKKYISYFWPELKSFIHIQIPFRGKHILLYSLSNV